jgi:hypothetical protein
MPPAASQGAFPRSDFDLSSSSGPGSLNSLVTLAPLKIPTLEIDIDNPPKEYFEALRRLRLEPPDEETVERILKIARRIWRKQDQEKLTGQEGGGGAPS